MKGEEQFKNEVEEFLTEKERIKELVGKIGGATGTKQNSIINNILLFVIVLLLLLGGLLKKIKPELAILVAIMVGILKLLWMFYEAQKANHFQFWILNSLEFRINEMYKRVKKMEKILEEKDKK